MEVVAMMELLTMEVVATKEFLVMEVVATKEVLALGLTSPLVLEEGVKGEAL